MEAPATEEDVASAKGVIVMDHRRNNRVEYAGLAILLHLTGWLDQGITLASGVGA